MRVTVGQGLALVVTAILGIIAVPDLASTTAGALAAGLWLFATGFLILVRASKGVWFAIKAASVGFAWGLLVITGFGDLKQTDVLTVGSAVVLVDALIFRFVPGARLTGPRVRVD